MALATNGFPIISYLYEIGSTSYAATISCNDLTCSTFGSPNILRTPSTALDSTAILNGHDNLPFVVYSTAFLWESVHCNSQDCTSTGTPNPLPATVAPHRLPRVTLGPSFPIITTVGCKWIECQSADCTLNAGTRSLTQYCGRGMDVAVSPTNQPSKEPIPQIRTQLFLQPLLILGVRLDTLIRSLFKRVLLSLRLVFVLRAMRPRLLVLVVMDRVVQMVLPKLLVWR